VVLSFSDYYRCRGSREAMSSLVLAGFFCSSLCCLCTLNWFSSSPSLDLRAFNSGRSLRWLSTFGFYSTSDSVQSGAPVSTSIFSSIAAFLASFFKFFSASYFCFSSFVFWPAKILSWIAFISIRDCCFLWCRFYNFSFYSFSIWIKCLSSSIDFSIKLIRLYFF